MINREQLIQWCWQGVEIGGLQALEPSHFAKRYGVPIIEVTAYIPDRFYALLLLIDDVFSRVELPEPRGEEKEDYLFDGIMLYFEQAQPYQTAIRKLWADLCWSPLESIKLIPHLTKPIHQMVDLTFGNTYWVVQQINYKAYEFLILETFLVWLDDETPDLSKTMAKLDFGLKRLQSYRSYFSSWA